MITVLVTGAGGGVGQGVIKSLKMISDLEIKIIAADMSELATGLYSSDSACLVERSTSPGYMKSLENIFQEFDVDFYIPGTDVELKFCADNKEYIKSAYGVDTIVSSADTIDIADDKYKTFEFLRAQGFNHPKTKNLKDYVVGEIDFPVIVKPAIGCRSIGVFKVENDREMQPHLYAVEGLILQECIGNDQTEYTCTIVKVGDEISPVLALKRDLRAGDTYRAYPVKSDTIEKYVHQIAGKLDIDGGCNFQLRLDKNGIPKLFEINSRFSGTTPFCAQLGFNPVEFYLKKRLGYSVDIEIDYDSSVLRYWAEVVVKNDQMTSLSRDRNVAPKLNSQFKMFD